jgi:hypothetical protein
MKRHRRNKAFAKIEKMQKRLSSSASARPFRTPHIAMIVIALIASIRTSAQTVPVSPAQLGRIMGTVTDVTGEVVAGATVVLTGPALSDCKTLVTSEGGFFEFDGVTPGVSFQVVVSATGFDDWKSPAIVLEPGAVKLLGSVQLVLAAQKTTVTVTYDAVKIATEQLKAEETQRVLGIIPNYYVSYEGEEAAPLTPKMKFQLALKVSYDPVTVVGVALMAGIRQATDSPNYPQGAKGYGERFGATSADGFSDIMIGSAILPSLLHEDPRYFYQGTGTTKSRLWHAMSSPFWSRRDSGTWGPNYSSIGGDLGSSALANLYFPKSSRGAGLVFSQFAIGTAERVIASVAQEFIVSKFTRRGTAETNSQ